MSYGELDRRARSAAAQLRASGIQSGERVLLAYPAGLEYLVAFLGCLYAGVVAVPAYPPRPNRPEPRLQAIVAGSETRVALTTTHIIASLRRRLAYASTLQSLNWLTVDENQGSAREWVYPGMDSSTLAFLQYTSGSTATPKGVKVTHGNLLHNLAMIYHALEHTRDSQMVSWLPPYHDMGLIVGLLQPLYGGFPVSIMPPASFLQRPLAWLQTISRLGADSAGAPNFAYDLCARMSTPEERENLDLSNWKVAFSGAEPVRKETLRRFTEVFAPCGFRHEAFFPAYGLAEATVFVSGGSKAAPPVERPFKQTELSRDRAVAAPPGSRDAKTLVGCGRTLAGQEIAVADTTGLTRCPDGQVGEVWVSGPSVAHGYWGRPEETRQTFQAYLADTGEGPFLRTGDLGFMHRGELFLTGRLKDLIVIRGSNHYPQDIEQTVMKSHVALRPDCGAAFSVEAEHGEELIIVQEVERSYVRSTDPEEVVAAIRRAVADEHELQPHAIVLTKPGSIPRTTSGKLQRQATRTAYLDNTLAIVAQDAQPPTAGREDGNPGTCGSEIQKKGSGEVESDHVLSIVQEFAGRRGHTRPVRLGDLLQGDLGLDSIAIAELLMEMETTFEVRLGESALVELRTVEDIGNVVHRASEAGSQDSTESVGVTGLQERIFQQIPQLGATVSEQDGRNVKIDERWHHDFASANYLGLDLHPTVMASIPEAIQRWGVHPSWTRAVASPQIYEELEQEIARFTGAPHVLLFPTVTLLHNGILPVLAGNEGVILLDRAAHNSMQEAARLARSQGTLIDWFDRNDPEALEQRLQLYGERSRKIIAVDGVYSMSGAYPPLPELVRIARKHSARVYVDDAHGFGVIGENPTQHNPYGDLGNGIVRYFGLDYGDDIVYVGGMSKALSSMAAFVTCADEAEKRQLSKSSTSVFSGPCPTASLASALAGLKIAQDSEGAAIRRRLMNLTRQLVGGARALGFTVDNVESFPIVGVRIGTVDNVVRACEVLWRHGILITPALFPAVPIDHGALRFTVTAVNTEEQVHSAIEALRQISEELLLN